jgi:hypothetical protein
MKHGEQPEVLFVLIDKRHFCRDYISKIYDLLFLELEFTNRLENELRWSK